MLYIPALPIQIRFVPPMTLPYKSHFHRLVRDLRVVMQTAQLEPELILGSALAKWCNECFPGLPPPGLPSALALQDEPAVSSFVEFVSKLDL